MKAIEIGCVLLHHQGHVTAGSFHTVAKEVAQVAL